MAPGGRCTRVTGNQVQAGSRKWSLSDRGGFMKMRLVGGKNENQLRWDGGGGGGKMPPPFSVRRAAEDQGLEKSVFRGEKGLCRDGQFYRGGLEN